MQSIVVCSKRRVQRRKKFLLALTAIILTAIIVTCFGNETIKEDFKEFWKNTSNSLSATMSIHTIGSYSPIIKYGLYAESGNETFLNWEQALLKEHLGKKQCNILEVVDSIQAENDKVKEVSMLDNTLIIDRAMEENSLSGEVGLIYGESYFEAAVKEASLTNAVSSNTKILEQLKSSKNLQYLINNFYIVDSTTSIDKSVFNVEKLLKKDCTIKQSNEEPQIMIYHTHGGSESYVDSDGTKNESVVGVGTVLAELLTEEYGYNVIHDETCYDVINGKIDRDKAYDKALKGISATLEKYPSIEVMIDLHRDSASKNQKRVTTIDGEETAQIMFFNGLSRKASGENISYLKNSNLQGNLAFSLKMKMKAMELYPDITTKIYLKGYRYNLHLREKSLLIELGTNLNTVAEAKRAMTPLAEVLNQVLNE